MAADGYYARKTLILRASFNTINMTEKPDVNIFFAAQVSCIREL